MPTKAELEKKLAELEAKLEEAKAQADVPAVQAAGPVSDCDENGRTTFSGRVWDSVTKGWKHKADIEKRNRVLFQ